MQRKLHAAGLRRYGFHGLSYDFIVSRLGEIDPALARSQLVIAHLGNGASLCAVAQGRSVASTMGFTAADSLMMGTRYGALDPGVLLYLMQERGLDAKAIEDLLYRRSGLLGVSGISSDMRTLRQSKAPEAAEAMPFSSTASCARPVRSPPPWVGWKAWCSQPESAKMMRRRARRSRLAAAFWA